MEKHGWHLVGKVLQEIARRLTGAVRIYDAVGRFGGEEFLVLLPRCDLRIISERANQLVEIIGKTPVASSAGELTVTASIGVLCATRKMSAPCSEEDRDGAKSALGEDAEAKSGVVSPSEYCPRVAFRQWLTEMKVGTSVGQQWHTRSS